MASQVSPGSLTERLQLLMRGDTAGSDALVREIMPKLREIAMQRLRRERYAAPLSKTELIHELWLRNLSKGGWQIHDRAHFYALASTAMRYILVDLARKRLASVRGGGEAPVSLDEARGSREPWVQDAARIVEIDILLKRLEEKEPDAARMVEMHYFMGLTFDEIAQETGLTVKQVRSRWDRGLGWLKRMLRSRESGRSSLLRTTV